MTTELSPERTHEILNRVDTGTREFATGYSTLAEAGEDTDERLIRTALQKHAGTGIVHDQALLNTLHGDALRRRCGHTAVSVTYSGMTLTRLGTVVEKLSNGRPERKIYVAANVSSEHRSSSEAEHRVLLTGVSKDAVVVNDPSPDTSGQDRTIAKSQFFGRWAAAFNAGYIVIADPA